MNKRTMFMVGAVSAALLTSAGAVNATPTKNTIYVDGTKVNGAAYMINNNNYFKLRDVAAMVNGSSKQFEVSWNETNKRIDLTTNKAYTVVGGEMALPSNAAKTAKESKASVFKDGNKADYTGYNISDNNYYKLRDFASALDVGLTWDKATDTAAIDTGSHYKPDATQLITGNWAPATRARIQAVIDENANQGKYVVFDFDNTSVIFDIQEAPPTWRPFWRPAFPT